MARKLSTMPPICQANVYNSLATTRYSRRRSKDSHSELKRGEGLDKGKQKRRNSEALDDLGEVFGYWNPSLAVKTSRRQPGTLNLVPITRIQKGRPRKQRLRPGEGRVRNSTCSTCGQVEHNARTCRRPHLSFILSLLLICPYRAWFSFYIIFCRHHGWHCR